MSNWCQTHPKYSAKRAPRSLCGDCWRLYFLKNPEEKTVVLETYTELEKMKDDFQL